MITGPAVLVVAVVCAVGAYGIQKRRPWAWWLGLVFQFIAATVLGLCALWALGEIPNAVMLLGQGLELPRVLWLFVLVVGSTGAGVLWVGWAAWWARRRRDFGIRDDE